MTVLAEMFQPSPPAELILALIQQEKIFKKSMTEGWCAPVHMCPHSLVHLWGWWMWGEWEVKIEAGG